MSNIYKIGTRGLTPYDNNYLVWDADVRCLYIDKENKVDVLNIVDTFNASKEVPYPTAFTLSTGGYIARMKLQTSGEYAGKYTDEYTGSYANHIIYDVVWDAEAKQISSFTYNDYDFSNNIWFLHLTEVTGNGGIYEGLSEVGAITKTGTIASISTKFTSYSTEAVPTLAGVKDVFDTAYFNIEDGNRVAPKLATTSVKGVASFSSNQFSTSAGKVYMKLATSQFTTSTTGVYLKTTTNKTVGTTYSNYVDYVKERKQYSDGSWYRLWASGWLEQGYVFQGYAYNNANRYLSFNKEFADTNYICTGACASTAATNNYARTIYFGEKTTTSVAVATGINGNSGSTQLTNLYFAGWSA